MGVARANRSRWFAAAVRASAGLGVAAGLLLAVGSLALGAQPFRGVPGWAWLAVAFACLLVREAQGMPGPRPALAPVRKGRRPR
ncbi:MAG: hypothetical protein JRH10_13990 [Deltaproteobacteria bacterium]|nr:hypothetical protein [Deltaproteobacteria bacterium]